MFSAWLFACPVMLKSWFKLESISVGEHPLNPGDLDLAPSLLLRRPLPCTFPFYDLLDSQCDIPVFT